jgi:hypothetical protein
MTKLLSRDDILQVQDLKTEEVDMRLFGWPGSVVVRGMTGLERGEVEYLMTLKDPVKQEDNQKKFRALTLVRCIVDQEGKPLFRPSDVDSLSTKAASALDHLTDIAQKLSGYRQADLEAVTKNFSTGQSEDSTTG